MGNVSFSTENGVGNVGIWGYDSVEVLDKMTSEVNGYRIVLNTTAGDITLDAVVADINTFSWTSMVQSFEAGFSEGYSQGYNDGYADGYADGFNDGFKAGVASVS